MNYKHITKPVQLVKILSCNVKKKLNIFLSDKSAR